MFTVKNVKDIKVSYSLFSVLDNRWRYWYVLKNSFSNFLYRLYIKRIEIIFYINILIKLLIKFQNYMESVTIHQNQKSNQNNKFTKWISKSQIASIKMKIKISLLISEYIFSYFKIQREINYLLKNNIWCIFYKILNNKLINK